MQQPLLIFQFFFTLIESSFNENVCIKTQHKEAYVISYHGALHHDILYAMTITSSLLPTLPLSILQAVRIFRTVEDFPPLALE